MRQPTYQRIRPTVPIAIVTALAVLGVTLGCATVQQRDPYTTKRDKTAKGAAIGAAVGAAGAIAKGKEEADEILAGAAIGAVVGGGVGAYMDHQEEKLARIPGTSVERVDENTLLIHFNSDVLFDVDSSVIRPEGRTTLDQVASVMMEYEKTAAVIQGHTDSTGSEEHNQALSERRAKAVYNYLVSRGVRAERMTAIGHGEALPVASNDTEYGRQQNRRVDILLRAKAK